MKTIQEKIAVMQAFADGKSIECINLKEKDISEWYAVPVPLFNWSEFDYRVKPEVREFWFIKSMINGSHLYYAYPDKEDAEIARQSFVRKDIKHEFIHVKEVT